MEDTSLDEFFDDERADDDTEEDGPGDNANSDGERKPSPASTDESAECSQAGTDTVSEQDAAGGQPEDGGDHAVTTNDTAVSTAQWSQSGESCSRCGTEGGRLWNDNGEFVCRACKEW